MIVKVTTQAEMDAALENPNAEVWLIGSGVFTVSGSASVRASGSASVRAWGSASVTASDSASVTASGSASVRAWDSASVTASGSASVTEDRVNGRIHFWLSLIIMGFFALAAVFGREPDDRP